VSDADRAGVWFGRRERAAPVAVRHFSGHLAHSERLSSSIKVAHLTDQHFGAVTPMRIQELAIALTVAERPDLVMLTGDFVAHSHAYLDQLVAALTLIDAPKYAVLGNHDHWSGASEDEGVLRRASAPTCAYSAMRITDGRTCAASKLPDRRASTTSTRATRDLDERREGALDRVAALARALAHRRRGRSRCGTHGVPLVLSGHTHAGQVTLAKHPRDRHRASLAGHRYVHGLYGDRGGARRMAPSTSAQASARRSMPLRLGERGRARSPSSSSAPRQAPSTSTTRSRWPCPAARRHPS
jgi:predicted MPP superfamily phosphohydrolase